MAFSLLLPHASVMSWSAKFVAAWLIALCVAPMTAPFSTCDFGSLTRHDRLAREQTAHAVWFKVPVKPNKSPALAQLGQSAGPAAGNLSTNLRAGSDWTGAPRRIRPVLRI